MNPISLIKKGTVPKQIKIVYKTQIMGHTGRRKKSPKTKDSVKMPSTAANRGIGPKIKTEIPECFRKLKR